MFFQWKQLQSRSGEPEKWVLIHKDTNKQVVGICLSRYGDMYCNWKIRKKITMAYELYYGSIWFKSLKFF